MGTWCKGSTYIIVKCSCTSKVWGFGLYIFMRGLGHTTGNCVKFYVFSFVYIFYYHVFK